MLTKVPIFIQITAYLENNISCEIFLQKILTKYSHSHRSNYVSKLPICNWEPYRHLKKSYACNQRKLISLPPPPLPILLDEFITLANDYSISKYLIPNTDRYLFPKYSSSYFKTQIPLSYICDTTIYILLDIYWRENQSLHLFNLLFRLQSNASKNATALLPQP